MTAKLANRAASSNVSMRSFQIREQVLPIAWKPSEYVATYALMYIVHQRMYARCAYDHNHCIVPNAAGYRIGGVSRQGHLWILVGHSSRS